MIPVAEEKSGTVAPPVVVLNRLPVAGYRLSGPVKARNKLIVVLLGLLLLVTAGWFLLQQKETPVTLPNSVIKVRTKDPVVNDTNAVAHSARTVRAAIPGPVAESMIDTLRISSTQNLADLVKYADSTGRSLVLMPAKKIYQRLPAVEITKRSAKPGDTLLIKNLRLVGFDTGINIHTMLESRVSITTIFFFRVTNAQKLI